MDMPAVEHQQIDRRVPGEGGSFGWGHVRELMRTALASGLLGLLGTVPANAAVNLRVEARPVSDPIKAYATVTDADGRPISSLTGSDFNVLVDGVAIPSPSFSQPASQDPSQKVSVIFVMDFSGSVTGTSMTLLQESVVDFINNMKPGDYAAVVKFNNTNPLKASVVQPFTQIDGGAGTSALVSAVMAPYPGSGTNLFDAVNLAAEQFRSPPMPLPPGPKAIVVASDGGENASSLTGNAAVDLANQLGVSIFTIGIGSVQTGSREEEILKELAVRSGGQYIPGTSDAQIADAYVKVSTLLNNEYVLTFTSTITDCKPHTLEVRVTGQPATSATFTRCTETPPPPPPPSGGGGGGGGGGSTGLLEFIAGVSLLALRRRRRAA